ncbi:peptidoglycan/LPS O-acetylase OafA/YrhL [Frondihabitans sp. PhB188]|uniref:acyltransferase family protein n=1 Tax=Frondihabitans sp. PhB188 TaxID=2485200 RepID=UPI000FA6DB3C|nr:acyltransferase family protein [Frondihabitans sp. PhB188]ROQ36657.1 peptidoglycan/LPS O-acetylase OafA/YrhL [Frondihabitans sp. PhB188]
MVDARQHPRAAFRPEIQVLRAFAVAAVVVYHFWPARLPGGFVGVDVFFVISGFLITSHLLRELASTGHVRLASFWARRARRLLPASLLVLAVTALATLALVPRAYWQQTFREIVGSALYVQNWVLAGDSIDYLASSNAASPVQHFWSLSVEEQFYLVWPVLLLIVAVWAGRGRRAAGREQRVVWRAGVVLGAVAVASFACSVVLTRSSPGLAYFATTTRAWEFAAGGLLAVAAARAAEPPVAGTPAPAVPLRTVAAWAGAALLAASLVLIDGATPFPGVAAALPVAGTLLVIAAGSAPWSPSALLARRPVLVLGDLSYSVYLWHWPALVVLGFRLGDGLTWPLKLVCLVGVLGLAWLSARFVEHPARRARFLTTARPRRTFAALAVAVAVVAVPVAVGGAALQRQATDAVEAAQAQAGAGKPCFGAAALDPGASCGAPPTTLSPDPALAADDLPPAYEQGRRCLPPESSTAVVACTSGSGSVRVALVGDSHAASWEPTIRAAGVTRGWSLTTYLHSGCPFTTITESNPNPTYVAACTTWNTTLAATLADDEPFDIVFVSHSQHVPDSAAAAAAEVRGYSEAWQPLLSRGTRVIVIADTSRAPADAQACLETHATDPGSCSLKKADAYLAPDAMLASVESTDGAEAIDLTDRVCPGDTCLTAIGGVVVYRDTHHLTATYARTLGPALGRAFDRLATG